MNDLSHPVQFRRYSDDEVHIWSSYSPQEVDTTVHDPAIILENNFREIDGRDINIVSDASVHTDIGSAAGAWHIFHDRNEKRRVDRPLESFPFSHSHRMEMETALYALADVSKLCLVNPTNKIIQRFDSQSGIKKLQSELSAPKDLMESDMDIILAYKHLTTCMEHSVQQMWVRGHADSKEEDLTNITPMEQENIECDEAAEECQQQEHPVPPYTPPRGY